MNDALRPLTLPPNGAFLVLVQEGKEESCRVGRWVERPGEGYSSKLYRFIPVVHEPALRDRVLRLLHEERGRSPLLPGYYPLPSELLGQVTQQPSLEWDWLSFCFTNITINPLDPTTLSRERRSGRLITLAAYQAVEDTGGCTVRPTATDLTISFRGKKTPAWEDIDEGTGVPYRAFTIKLPGDVLLMYCESTNEGCFASLLDVQ